MTEETSQPSIQARIAALNLGHVGRAPTMPSTTVGEQEEEAMDRPEFNQRSHSISVAPTLGQHSISMNGIGNEPRGPKRYGVLPPPTITRTGQSLSKPSRPKPPPRLPPRKESLQLSPALPPRQPSGKQLVRRDSSESLNSTISTISSASVLSDGTARTSTSVTRSTDRGRRIPPAFNSSTLPSLPQRSDRATEKARMPFVGTKSTPNVTRLEKALPPKLPSLPPRTPARPTVRNESSQSVRKLPPQQPPDRVAKSALSFRMNKPDSNEDDIVTNRQDSIPATEDSEPSPAPGSPPPVPLASRPDLSRLLATKPKPQPVARSQTCLLCRDFSGPDIHAAKFPRESVPSLDWLANQLVAPFPSPTDKARAIFTWLHHNISYDVVAFFNNKVQPSTPASTLATGLAVCEGYAGLFTTIAAKAGLESIVIGGHGKGYGHSTPSPGAPVPPQSSGHAWNAVKIDNGEWKLIDPCWGAGNVSGKGQPYNKQFSPSHFTKSNEDFGLTHFPNNQAHFFRNDGRQISWEEYITNDRRPELVRIYGGVVEEEGFSKSKFLPEYLKIPVRSPQHRDASNVIRFLFERLCEHWDPIRNGPGKPYIYILSIHGLDGREDDSLPFETDGRRWWLDVQTAQLGAPGQTITIYAISTFGNESGRGLSLEDYRQYKGRKGWSGNALAAWELV